MAAPFVSSRFRHKCRLLSGLHALSIHDETGGFSGLSMDFLYSLYDALVSINVPSDKARAVVDAMERDMGTTLATKQDLEFQTLATRKDLEILRMGLKQDLETLKAETRQNIDALRGETRQNIDALRGETKQNIDALRAETKQNLDALKAETKQAAELLKRDIAALDQKMTIKIGWMLFLGLGLVVAVLRLWV
jgi:viroplasmin and RNaseH domain-containing protein